MNRVTDYVSFAVGFIGLGYIVLWPLTAHDSGIAALQVNYICAALPLEGFCRAVRGFRHGLPLSPGLHVLGSLAIACLIARLLLRVLRRLWQRYAARPTVAPGLTASTLDRPPHRLLPPLPPLRPVKPRTHFGLRGLPH